MGSAMHHSVKPPHTPVLWWEPPSISTPSPGTRGLPSWQRAVGGRRTSPCTFERFLPIYILRVSTDQGVRSVVLPGNTISSPVPALLLWWRGRTAASSAAVPLHPFGVPLADLSPPLGEQHPSRAPSPQLLGTCTPDTFTPPLVSSEWLHTALWPHTHTPATSLKHLRLPRQIFS